MSASNELILQQIRDTEEALLEARKLEDSVALVSLQQKLKSLILQFNSLSTALTEGKEILKG